MMVNAEELWKEIFYKLNGKKQTDKETWGKDSCSSDSADTGEWIESSDEDMDSYDEEDEDWEIEMEEM